LDITRSIRYQVRAPVYKVKSRFIQSARDRIAELSDLHRFESDAVRLEFIDSLLAERVGGGVRGPNPTKRMSKDANEWPVSTLLPD
jgi:lipoate-protein ligase A